MRCVEGSLSCASKRSNGRMCDATLCKQTFAQEKVQSCADIHLDRSDCSAEQLRPLEHSHASLLLHLMSTVSRQAIPQVDLPCSERAGQLGAREPADSSAPAAKP